MRTTLVPAVLALLVVMPIGAQDARPSAAPARSFAAATVKLNRSGLRQRTIGFEPGGRFVARNMPLRFVIGRAFGGGEVLPPYLIDGAPPWIETEPYDIEAVPDAADLDGLEEVRRRDALLEMLRDLLETRFGLRARWEPRERPVYAAGRRSDRLAGPVRFDLRFALELPGGPVDGDTSIFAALSEHWDYASSRAVQRWTCWSSRRSNGQLPTDRRGDRQPAPRVIICCESRGERSRSSSIPLRRFAGGPSA